MQKDNLNTRPEERLDPFLSRKKTISFKVSFVGVLNLCLVTSDPMRMELPSCEAIDNRKGNIGSIFRVTCLSRSGPVSH